MHTKRRKVAFALAACGIVASVAAVLASAGGAARQQSGLQNTKAPVLSGKTVEGETMSVTDGTWTWDGTPLTRGTYAYQWRRCDKTGNNCVQIPNQAKDTYTLTGADVKYAMRAYVTASYSGASKVAPSNYSVVVTAIGAAPVNTKKPTISGTPTQGSTLLSLIHI